MHKKAGIRWQKLLLFVVLKTGFSHSFIQILQNVIVKEDPIVVVSGAILREDKSVYH
jgi:hypothetical protein